jgi:heme exporter protein B
MSMLGAVLQKDLLLTWRGRARAVAVFAFGATTLLLFSFASGPDTTLLRHNAGGFLWLALLLASTLALSESFQAEMEQRALEGLLLLPASPALLFIGKAVANWLQLTALGCALVPVLVVLYDAPMDRAPELLGIILLGTAGLSAPGTLHAALAAQIRAREVMLPLLFLPLVVPVLLAAVKATSLVMYGDPMGQLSSWVLLLACFNGIFWPLCGLLFSKVVDD